MAKIKPPKHKLQELASQKGMTYTRMGNILQVDRKTAKKWCDEDGIVIGKTAKEDVAPEPESPKVSTGIEYLERQVKELRNQIESFIAEIKTPVAVLEEAPAIGSAADYIIHLANQLHINEGEVAGLDQDGQEFMAALGMLCEAAMRETIDLLHHRINIHKHVILNVGDSRQYLIDKKERMFNANR